jgi:hypothetical protein
MAYNCHGRPSFGNGHCAQCFLHVSCKGTTDLIPTWSTGYGLQLSRWTILWKWILRNVHSRVELFNPWRSSTNATLLHKHLVLPLLAAVLNPMNLSNETHLPSALQCHAVVGISSVVTSKQSKHLPPKDFCSDMTADVGWQGTMVPQPHILDVAPACEFYYKQCIICPLPILCDRLGVSCASCAWPVITLQVRGHV